MSNADPLAWLLEGLLAQAQQPLWRSVDRWRRRDSLLLVGLLGLIDYLLVAIIVFGGQTTVASIAIGVLAAPLAALVLAEAAFAIRPTPRRLARADRLVLVTVGVFFALGVLGAVAMAIGAA